MLELGRRSVELEKRGVEFSSWKDVASNQTSNQPVNEKPLDLAKTHGIYNIHSPWFQIQTGALLQIGKVPALSFDEIT